MNDETLIPTQSAATSDNPDFSDDADMAPSSFWDDDSSVVAPQRVSRLWLRPGEPAILRYVTRELVKAHVHFGIQGADGKKLTVRCNKGPGQDCALCLGGFRPTEVYLLLVFNVGEGDLTALTLYKDGGAGSLRTQLTPIIKRPDYLNVIIQVTKVAQRHEVRLLEVVDPSKPRSDGVDYGDAVLRDIYARGLPTAEDVLATLEVRDNQMLLEDVVGLKRKVQLLNPGVELAVL
ncbi:hypothetical protein [Myxococcus sp. Y35]|uniref:hypothetical protein n=1 Tax=Pseudomyxococcus flavus TaxID=3115648 RepID=UPI003CF574BA